VSLRAGKSTQSSLSPGATDISLRLFCRGGLEDVSRLTARTISPTTITTSSPASSSSFVVVGVISQNYVPPSVSPKSCEAQPTSPSYHHEMLSWDAMHLSQPRSPPRHASPLLVGVVPLLTRLESMTPRAPGSRPRSIRLTTTSRRCWTASVPSGRRTCPSAASSTPRTWLTSATTRTVRAC
jgi:hypothetical protein